MVMPFCYDNINDMFEAAQWNETAFEKGCEERWKVKPRPKMADIQYGAKKLQAASNIVFRSVSLYILYHKNRFKGHFRGCLDIHK